MQVYSCEHVKHLLLISYCITFDADGHQLLLPGLYSEAVTPAGRL